jgi:hypothetical protein
MLPDALFGGLAQQFPDGLPREDICPLFSSRVSLQCSHDEIS